MYRRDFIRHSAALTASAPFLHMAHRYLPTDTDIIGHGSFRYRVHHDWHRGKPLPVKDCHEMVQAPDGRLFLLTNHTANNVIVYDRSGEVLDSWGDAYPGAHGLTLSEEGGEAFLWITDEKTGAVVKHTLDGREVLSLEPPLESGYYADRSEYKPTETTVDARGRVYVADGYGKNYVHRYSPGGRYELSFGGTGTAPALLDCAHGVAIDTRTDDPTILVTSRTEQAFKRFTLDGEHLATYPTPGMWICRPVIRGAYTYFAVIVTETWYGYDGMIAVFDADMRLVSAPGATSERIEYAGGALVTPISDQLTFLNPHDVCLDADENLYVPQWYSGRTYPVMLERVSA